MKRPSVRDVLIVLGVAILYIACAKLGLALAFRAAQVTSVWPPTGFAIAAVIRLRRRAIPGILLGAFIANATTAEPLAVAAAIAIGNTLEALVCATLLRRVAFDGRLTRLNDVLSLIAAVAMAAVVSATIGVSALGAGRVQPIGSLPALWWIWWFGDVLGGLTVAPPILAWSARDPMPRRRGAIAEAALMLVLLFIYCTIVFSLPPRTAAIAHVVYVFLIWGALRLGPPATTTAVVVANAVAVWGTHAGRGPFAGAGPEQGLVLLQMFMAVAAITGLTLGAVAAQNRSAQQRAEISERRLLMAMGAARIGVWDWNIVTGEVFWSEGMEPLHGLPVGGFAGTYEAYRKLIHPDDLERVEAAIQHAVQTQSLYNAEFRLLGADGVVRWTDARGQVVLGENGKPERMVGVGIDITHQKELEEALRQEGRRKDEFLAMLGHELRNPLAPILHAVEMLEGDPRYVDIIRRQSKHLAHLVDDLLDVSRITSGKVRLEKRRVTLSEIVTSAVNTWRHLVDQRRQQLSIDIPREPIWLDVDPIRMTQVIANLLHNASKFTPEEGRIAITAEKEKGSLVLRLRDSGVGMSEEVLAHAFELFVQGPPSLDRPHGGLGLGLTLVRQLVEMHGGTVTASSPGSNQGSELTVRLPAVLSAAPLPAARPSLRPSAPRRRILVVEDNPDAREILVVMLKRDGHEVRAAADGPAALAEAARFAPDVVLLDIGLPGMDGYDVARELRAMPQTEGALLIAVTGYGHEDDRERSQAAGIDHHLIKPVDRATLAELLNVPKADEGERMTL